MNKIISVAWFLFVLANLCIIGSAYGKEDIMGDPATSLADISPQIKWVTGSFQGLFMIAGVLGIFAGAIYFFAGNIVGSSESKSKGIGGIIGAIAVTILVTIALTLLFTITTKF